MADSVREALVAVDGAEDAPSASDEPKMTTRPWLKSTRRRIVAALVFAAGIVAACTTSSWRRPAAPDDLGMAYFESDRWARELMSLRDKDAPPVNAAAVDGMNCFLDTYQAVLRLSNAAANVAQANRNCDPAVLNADLSNTATNACISALVGAIYNFLFTAGMIAASISDCSRKLDLNAACTAAVMGMTGNLGATIAHTSGSIVACEFIWDDDWKTSMHKEIESKREEFRHNISKNISERLHPLRTKWKESRVAQWIQKHNDAKLRKQIAIEQQVRCWTSVSQSIVFAGRASNAIISATDWCRPVKQGEHKGQLNCAINMIGLINGLASMARYISASIPQCLGVFSPDNIPVTQAQCTSEILGVVAGVTGVITPAMGMEQTCGLAVKERHEKKAEPAEDPAFEPLVPDVGN